MDPDESPAATTEKRPARVIYFLGFLLVLVALGWALWSGHRRTRARTTDMDARAREVQAGPLVAVARVLEPASLRKITLPADVRGIFETTLYAKVSGYLVQISVDKGTQVRQGDLLATIESPATDQQLLSAEAEVQNARRLATRARTLAPPGVVSQQDLEQAEAALSVAEANYRSALAEKGYESIRAPFSGTITARYVDPGALLPAPTSSTGTALPVVDLADTRSLRLLVYVGQDAASSIIVGTPVSLVGADGVAPRLQATVTRVASALDSRTRTMLCEIDIDNRKYGILPGTFLNATLDVKTAMRPMVPMEALFLRTGKYLVAVVADERLHFVPVELGRIETTTIEITAGILGGETVAVNVPSELDDGAKIQPVWRPGSAVGGGPPNPDGGAPNADGGAAP